MKKFSEQSEGAWYVNGYTVVASSKWTHRYNLYDLPLTYPSATYRLNIV